MSQKDQNRYGDEALKYQQFLDKTLIILEQIKKRSHQLPDWNCNALVNFVPFFALIHVLIGV